MSERREEYITLKEYLESKFNDMKEDLKKLNSDHDKYNETNIKNSEQIKQLCTDLSEHKKNHKYFAGLIFTGVGIITGAITWLIDRIFK